MLLQLAPQHLEVQRFVHCKDTLFVLSKARQLFLNYLQVEFNKTSIFNVGLFYALVM